ncbi:MAG: hypothetical protein ACKO85_07045 [Isosphaeraceae bacterium]
MAKAESSRSSLSAIFGPWHDLQEFSRTGRILVSKNDISSALRESSSVARVNLVSEFNTVKKASRKKIVVLEKKGQGRISGGLGL